MARPDRAWRTPPDLHASLSIVAPVILTVAHGGTGCGFRPGPRLPGRPVEVSPLDQSALTPARSERPGAGTHSLSVPSSDHRVAPGTCADPRERHWRRACPGLRQTSGGRPRHVRPSAAESRTHPRGAHRDPVCPGWSGFRAAPRAPPAAVARASGAGMSDGGLRSWRVAGGGVVGAQAARPHRTLAKRDDGVAPPPAGRGQVGGRTPAAPPDPWCRLLTRGFASSALWSADHPTGRSAVPCPRHGCAQREQKGGIAIRGKSRAAPVGREPCGTALGQPRDATRRSSFHWGRIAHVPTVRRARHSAPHVRRGGHWGRTGRPGTRATPRGWPGARWR